MRYLTKSRFKLALECLTKLYYTKRPEYADTNIDDPFLQALADGGFQVGELAKYYFCDDPINEKITIGSLDYKEALEETRKRLTNNNVIIAEAGFSFESLFVRVDILEKKGSEINIYEVKSKSVDGDQDKFLNKSGELSSKWVDYFYDIAFQKYVVENALDREVNSFLLLVDKTKRSTVDGLNQKFKIFRDEKKRSYIKVVPELKRSDLGDSILKAINTDDLIKKIWSSPVPNTELGFKEFLDFSADIYKNETQHIVNLGSKCKKCQFVNTPKEYRHLKSGFLECWKSVTRYNEDLLKNDLVIELWGGRAGSKSLVQELINNNIFLLRDTKESIIAPSKISNPDSGLSPHQRRMEQINRVIAGETSSYSDSEGFLAELKKWKYPLHMIDFETSRTALPIHKDRHPYEGIAFQFSHHIMEANGQIYHAGQFLSFEPGVFPNYHFVRELKKQLQVDDGTIFRYHTHENSYLNNIYDQLNSDLNPPNDKEELKQFISSITSRGSGKGKIVGSRNMVDLYEVILKYYYSPYAKGSNSIKQILPALIKDSNFLKDKYSKPIYGKSKEIKSLNFDNHIWINAESENDPYKTLPRLFEEYDPELLDELFTELNEVSDGGTAMTAYNYLQFSEIPEEQRLELKEGLLRYCELDTLAMVMIVEGLMKLCEVD